jgi:hypothetical protein
MSGEHLRRLTALTVMMQDARLAALSQAEAARQATLAAIAGLDQSPLAEGLDAVTSGLVHVGYARWADVRRKELGANLIRQTAKCDDARAAARIAFGRNQALVSVAAKVAQTKKLPPPPNP